MQKTFSPTIAFLGLLSLACPIILYIFLPALNIIKPAETLNFITLIKLSMVFMIAVLFFILLNRYFTVDNYTSFALIYLFNFANLTYLSDLSPVKIPFRVLTLSIIFMPTVFLFLKYWRDILSFYKNAGWIFSFIGIALLYYFFFSSGIYGSSTGAGVDEAGVFSQYGESKMDILYLFLLFFASIIFSWRLFASQNYVSYFYTINYIGMTAITVIYLMTMVIPGDSFYMVVEGIERFKSLYSHPNQLAHGSCLFLIYMLSLLGYYKEDLSKAKFSKFLIFAILVQSFVILLSLSKTALLTMGIVFVYFAKTAYSKNFYKLALTTITILTIGMIGMNLYSLFFVQNSIYALIEERFTNMESWYWRLKIWEILWDNNDFISGCFGHGMASAREYVSFFLQSRDESILIHNGYISFWYDYGIFFLLYLGYLISMFFYKIKNQRSYPLQVINAGLHSLALYILISGFLDEVFEGIYFFLLSALLLGLLSVSQHTQTASPKTGDTPIQSEG